MSSVCAVVNNFVQQDVQDTPLLLHVHEYFFKHLLSCGSEWMHSQLVFLFYIEVYFIKNFVGKCSKPVKIYSVVYNAWCV